MMFRPNPSSGIPIYLQLMEQVKDALETGAFRPGDQVPGIRPLAEELVISPNAVARAYRELEQERVIAQRQGAASDLVFTNELAERSRTRVPRRSSRELALENSRLTAQIAAEVANRVERNRELDLARDVQQRLFPRSEEHTSELQSHHDLVCSLLLEKKKKIAVIPSFTSLSNEVTATAYVHPLSLHDALPIWSDPAPESHDDPPGSWPSRTAG